MKMFLFCLLLLLIPGNLDRIARINRIKEQAEKAFAEKKYQEALNGYLLLVDSLQVNDENVNTNLAHCLYKLNKKEEAAKQYTNLASSSNKKISSIAHLQLGLLNYSDKKTEDALTHFKAAIKANPDNQEARYNYELLKKFNDQNKNNNDKKNDKNNDKNSEKQEPSEFAKKLKEEADKLVAMRQYGKAYNLMTEGLKKDNTVANFQDYISRIKDVSQINQ
jgi:tetratricopeptide (TPR) repeat protein